MSGSGFQQFIPLDIIYQQDIKVQEEKLSILFFSDIPKGI